MINLNENDICLMVKEVINKIINGDTTNIMEGIGMNEFPREGYCLIILGSPGSGKSYLRDTKIPIYGKIFDFDEVRDKYMNYLIKKKGLKKDEAKKVATKSAGPFVKQMEQNLLKNQTNIKNNIIVDAGGQAPKRGEKTSLVNEIIGLVKPFGYKIGVIWVATNRSVAMQRNSNRSRVLPDNSFHKRSNSINGYVPEFLKGSGDSLARHVDDAWIVFNSGPNLKDSNIPPTIHLTKNGNGFNIPDDLMSDLQSFVGPMEKNPSYTPTTYLSRAEFRKIEDTPNTYLRSDFTNQLNEGFSDIIYHNTSLKSLWDISKDGCFKLHESKTNKDPKHRSNFTLEKLTNNLVSTTGNYSMSFSRERNSKTGYAGYRNGDLSHLVPLDKRQNKVAFSNGYYVRFEIDGRALQFYLNKQRSGKGGPIDYYRESPSTVVFSPLSGNEDVFYKEINGVKYAFSTFNQKEIPLYVKSVNNGYIKAKETDKGNPLFKKEIKNATTKPGATFRNDLTDAEKTQIRQSEDRLVSNNESLAFYDFKNNKDNGFVKHIDIYFPVEAQKKAPSLLKIVYNAIYNENSAFAKIRKNNKDFIRIFHTRNDYDNPKGRYVTELSVAPENPKIENEFLKGKLISKCVKFGVAMYLINYIVYQTPEELFREKVENVIVEFCGNKLNDNEKNEFRKRFRKQWKLTLKKCLELSDKLSMTNFFKDVENNNQLKNCFTGVVLGELRKVLERWFNETKILFNNKFKFKKFKGTAAIGAYVFMIIKGGNTFNF